MQRRKKRVGLVTKVLIAAFAIYAACTLVNLQLRINAATDRDLDDLCCHMKLVIPGK